MRVGNWNEVTSVTVGDKNVAGLQTRASASIVLMDHTTGKAIMAVSVEQERRAGSTPDVPHLLRRGGCQFQYVIPTKSRDPIETSFRVTNFSRSAVAFSIHRGRIGDAPDIAVNKVNCIPAQSDVKISSDYSNEERKILLSVLDGNLTVGEDEASASPSGAYFFFMACPTDPTEDWREAQWRVADTVCIERTVLRFAGPSVQLNRASLQANMQGGFFAAPPQRAAGWGCAPRQEYQPTYATWGNSSTAASAAPAQASTGGWGAAAAHVSEPSPSFGAASEPTSGGWPSFGAHDAESAFAAEVSYGEPQIVVTTATNLEAQHDKGCPAMGMCLSICDPSAVLYVAPPVGSRGRVASALQTMSAYLWGHRDARAGKGGIILETCGFCMDAPVECIFSPCGCVLACKKCVTARPKTACTRCATPVSSVLSFK